DALRMNMMISYQELVRTFPNTEAISRLLAPAQNAKIERREIRRADYGLSSIGHMGFFRTRNAEKLWPLVAQWLERHCPDKRRTT
ncbi:hypothetical protein CQA41_19740, partial [Klebsiella pneumoniae]